jgi:DNA ligase 1
VSIFRPSLAVDASMDDFARLLMPNPLYASAKLDGIRAVVLNGQLVSRTLKPIRNRHIQSVLGQPEFEGLDGELVVGPPHGEGVFARTSSGVMSEFGEPDFTYWVFDDHSQPKQRSFTKRFETLNLRESGGPWPFNTQILEQNLVRDTKTLEQFEEHIVGQGYEGLILRHPQAPYKMGRSTLREGYMLKLKRFSDSEARIIDFVELMHNDNEATTDARGYTTRGSSRGNKIPGGTLGALRVQDLRRAEWAFQIGTGFSAETRQYIWDHQDEYRNRICAYTYLPVGTVDLPRHPVFKGMRSGDDIA